MNCWALLNMTTGQAKYSIQFCAHGSRWEPEKPEFVYTLEQAEAIRAEWRARANTVGGDVLISKEEMTWECVGHNPTSWSLGFYRDGKIHDVTAHVHRRKEDGAWSWSAWNIRMIGCGIEPSRIEAMRAAEKCLKEMEGLFFPDIWREKVPEKIGLH